VEALPAIAYSSRTEGTQIAFIEGSKGLEVGHKDLGESSEICATNRHQGGADTPSSPNAMAAAPSSVLKEDLNTELERYLGSDNIMFLFSPTAETKIGKHSRYLSRANSQDSVTPSCRTLTKVFEGAFGLEEPEDLSDVDSEADEDYNSLHEDDHIDEDDSYNSRSVDEPPREKESADPAQISANIYLQPRTLRLLGIQTPRLRMLLEQGTCLIPHLLSNTRPAKVYLFSPHNLALPSFLLTHSPIRHNL
jgi:hypothetical protein